MKYVRPEVVVLAPAMDAVQTPNTKGHTPAETPFVGGPGPAYEADE